MSPDECVLWWVNLTKDRIGNFVGGAGTLPRSATFDVKNDAALVLHPFTMLGKQDRPMFRVTAHIDHI